MTRKAYRKVKAKDIAVGEQMLHRGITKFVKETGETDGGMRVIYFRGDHFPYTFIPEFWCLVV